MREAGGEIAAVAEAVTSQTLVACWFCIYRGETLFTHNALCLHCFRWWVGPVHSQRIMRSHPECILSRLDRTNQDSALTPPLRTDPPWSIISTNSRPSKSVASRRWQLGWYKPISLFLINREACGNAGPMATTEATLEQMGSRVITWG